MHDRWSLFLHVGLAGLAGCAEEPGPPSGPAATGWPVQVFFDGSARPTYERVVLVTIDTLRVDHVSSYGYPRETTPFLDSLAARGVRFEEVLASVSHTAPSHATMLTGLVPRAHGVLVNGASLAPEALDLARVFAQAGYETAAFLNVAFLKRIAGSFETVEVRPVARGEGNQSARDVVDAVLAWARERRKSPRFFLWVHVYDPHEWEPRVRAQHGREESLWSGTSPADFAGRAAELHGLPPPEPGRPLSVPMPGGKEDASGVFGSDKLLRCIDAYDQRILEADREIARLAAGLEALVLPGRALWIVTSDHGEGLASHGYAGHTGRIFQEQLRVPLVLSASDGSLGPRVVPELVAHTDLFATLVETLGGRVAANEQMYTGRSLLPLARGEPVAWPARAHLAQRRPVTDPREKDRAEMYALQDGRHKLLRVEPGPDSLFDLRQDPLELHDLGPAAAEASELGRRLDEILRMFSEHALPAPAGPLPQDVLEELRALGYVR